MSIIGKIKNLAQGRFDETHVDQFISTFKNLVADSKVIGTLLQISTDEGEELELGFFTANTIADITLSRGKVYSYAFPLTLVKSSSITDEGSKWVLTIQGEKKFDYNVVKPNSDLALKEYQIMLQKNSAVSGHHFLLEYKY